MQWLRSVGVISIGEKRYQRKTLSLVIKALKNNQFQRRPITVFKANEDKACVVPEKTWGP